MSEAPAKFVHWTDDETALLRHLWHKGYSAGQIAKRLETKSRNAVIGKVHRLGIQRGRIINRSGAELRRRVVARSITKTRQGTIKKSLLRPLVIDAVTLAAGSVPPLNIDVMQLAPMMCRWPVTEDRPHRFCGHACKDEHSPYCSAHMVMAHRVEPPAPIEKYADWLTRHEYARAA